MRVLVDTSVWSLSLRKRGPADHPAVLKLSNMLDTGADLFLSGLILQEVLQAFRTESSFNKIKRYMEPFPLIALNRDDYILAARLQRKCAAMGSAASTADCQIAAAAIGAGCSLLTTDKDFQRLARISDLELA